MSKPAMDVFTPLQWLFGMFGGYKDALIVFSALLFFYGIGNASGFGKTGSLFLSSVALIGLVEAGKAPSWLLPFVLIFYAIYVAKTYVERFGGF